MTSHEYRTKPTKAYTVLLDSISEYIKSASQRVKELENTANALRALDGISAVDDPIEYLLCAEDTQDLYYERGVLDTARELERKIKWEIQMSQIGRQHD